MYGQLERDCKSVRFAGLEHPRRSDGDRYICKPVHGSVLGFIPDEHRVFNLFDREPIIVCKTLFYVELITNPYNNETNPTPQDACRCSRNGFGSCRGGVRPGCPVVGYPTDATFN